MICCLIYYAASQEDLLGCFVPGCWLAVFAPLPAQTSHSSTVQELITAPLVPTHQIRSGLRHNKSSQPERTSSNTMFWPGSPGDVNNQKERKEFKLLQGHSPAGEFMEVL